MRKSTNALLVNEELADPLSDAWDKGKIDGQLAWLAWTLLTWH